MSALEGECDRLRIELVEAESRATAAREQCHERELEIDRRQNQIGFDEQQIEQLETRRAGVVAELDALEGRRGPAESELETRREAARRAAEERDTAAAALNAATAAHLAAHHSLDEFELDVDRARREGFAATSAVAALTHAIENADGVRSRVLDEIGRLEAEVADLLVEQRNARGARERAAAALARARADLDAIRERRRGRQAELDAARERHERLVRDIRSGEQGVAGTAARQHSLEELDAARAGYGDAARLVLSAADPAIGQLGAVADFLEVDERHERAVEACLDDLLQHVVVETREQARAGLEFVRAHEAGRCGFLVVGSQECRRPGVAGPAAPGDARSPRVRDPRERSLGGGAQATRWGRPGSHRRLMRRRRPPR